MIVIKSRAKNATNTLSPIFDFKNTFAGVDF